MGKRQIIWSHIAQIKLFKILNFYSDRNKSKTYSIKLYHRINRELKILLKQPNIGLSTGLNSVRGLIIDNYILFYEYDSNRIIIHSIWDCRQNPYDLIIK